MDLNAFLTQTIENVVATIPALAVLASPLIYGLKKIKEVTSKFPSTVEDTKTTLTSRFSDTTEKMKTMLEEKNDVLQEKVNGSLVSMQEELAKYKQELSETKEKAEKLVEQNKVYMDSISELVGQDPKLVQNGVATKLANRLASLNGKEV